MDVILLFYRDFDALLFVPYVNEQCARSRAVDFEHYGWSLMVSLVFFFFSNLKCDNKMLKSTRKINNVSVALSYIWMAFVWMCACVVVVIIAFFSLFLYFGTTFCSLLLSAACGFVWHSMFAINVNEYFICGRTVIQLYDIVAANMSADYFSPSIPLFLSASKQLNEKSIKSFWVAFGWWSRFRSALEMSEREK